MEEIASLNKAQHFSFPHNNCDELSTAELMYEWYAPDYYCVYIINYVHTTHQAPSTMKTPEESLRTLKSYTWFGELGAAYMRLKFLLEVCDPQEIQKKIFPKMSNPSTMWQQPPLKNIWKYIDYEAYFKLNIFCNRVFIAILDGIKTHTPPSNELLAAVQSLNKHLPFIRSKPLEQFAWSTVSPTQLIAYPYFTFVLNAYQVVFQALCSEH